MPQSRFQNPNVQAAFVQDVAYYTEIACTEHFKPSFSGCSNIFMSA